MLKSYLGIASTAYVMTHGKICALLKRIASTGSVYTRLYFLWEIPTPFYEKNYLLFEMDRNEKIKKLSR